MAQPEEDDFTFFEHGGGWEPSYPAGPPPVATPPPPDVDSDDDDVDVDDAEDEYDADDDEGSHQQPLPPSKRRVSTYPWTEALTRRILRERPNMLDISHRELHYLPDESELEKVASLLTSLKLEGNVLNSDISLGGLAVLTKLRSLDLSSNGRLALPQETTLNALRSLETLLVANNQIEFTGELASQMQLRVLDLSNNSLHFLDIHVGNPSALQELKLNNNPGEEPDTPTRFPLDSISLMVNLRALELDYNNLSEFPVLPQAMSRLLTLLMHKGSISQVPAQASRVIGRLDHLHLGDHSISVLPEVFSYATVLRVLDLSNSGMLVELGDVIANMVRLRKLVLNNCARLNYISPEIGRLVSLQHLHMQSCHLLNMLPTTFGSLTTLHSLSLDTSTWQPHFWRTMLMDVVLRRVQDQFESQIVDEDMVPTVIYLDDTVAIAQMLAMWSSFQSSRRILASLPLFAMDEYTLRGRLNAMLRSAQTGTLTIQSTEQPVIVIRCAVQEVVRYSTRRITQLIAGYAANNVLSVSFYSTQPSEAWLDYTSLPVLEARFQQALHGIVNVEQLLLSLDQHDDLVGATLVDKYAFWLEGMLYLYVFVDRFEIEAHGYEPSEQLFQNAVFIGADRKQAPLKSVVGAVIVHALFIRQTVHLDRVYPWQHATLLARMKHVLRAHAPFWQVNTREIEPLKTLYSIMMQWIGDDDIK